MGRGWTRIRGETSQERDKVAEVLSTIRIVVILGGSGNRGEREYFRISRREKKNLSK